VEVKSLLVAILGISDDRNKKKESYFQKNMQITMEKHCNLHINREKREL